MAPDIPGLDPDESVLVTMTVTFRGSLAASWRGMGLVSARSRLKAFGVWAAGAEAANFPVGRPEMKIGVTEHRLIVWRPSFFSGRAADYIGSVPFDRLSEVTVYRQGLVVSLTFLFTDGQIVEVEAMRRGRMKRIAEIAKAGIPGHAR